MTSVSGGRKWLVQGWIAFGIFALALGLRLYFFNRIFGHGPAGELFSNDLVFSKYPWIAGKIAQHVPLGERILDFSPLYTCLVAALARLFPGSQLSSIMFQIFLGSINCLVVYAAAAIISSRTTAVISGLIAAVYAPFMLYECVLEPEILIISLNLVSLVLLHACLRGRRSFWWFLPGMTLGLSFIARPNILIFLLVVLLWLFLSFRESPQRLAPVLAALLAGFFVIIFPVLVRNYLVSGMVLKPLMSSGQVLYQGNNPMARGFYGSHPYLLKEMEVDPVINRDNEPDFAHELYRRFAGITLDTEAFWYQRSRNFAWQYPAAFLRLMGEKFRAFWSSYEIHDVLPLYSIEWEMSRLPLPGFGVVVPFAILGMLLAVTELRRHLLLYGFVLNYVASNLMFFVSSRQRLLALPFLVIFAASALSRGGAAGRSAVKAFGVAGAPLMRKARPLIGVAAGAIVVLCLFFLVNRPSPQLEHFETFLHVNRDSRLRLVQAQAAMNAGDYRGARNHFQAAFELMPFHPTRVPNRYLGGAGKKYAAAIRFWEGVLSRKSDNGYARFTLGYLFFLSGDFDRALREFRPLADAGEDFFLGYLLPIAQPRFYVARCLEELGDTAAAIAEYERIDRERPGQPWVTARLLVLREIAGDGGKVRALRSALEKLDNPISTSYLLAEAYYDRREYEKATRTLTEAPSPLLESYAPYRFLLSACYAQRGLRAGPANKQELIAAALRECRSGLKLGTNGNRIPPVIAAAYLEGLSGDPGNPQLSYELGLLYYSLGELEDARARLEAALVSRPGTLTASMEQSIRRTLEEIAVIERSAGDRPSKTASSSGQ